MQVPRWCTRLFYLFILFGIPTENIKKPYKNQSLPVPASLPVTYTMWVSPLAPWSQRRSSEISDSNSDPVRPHG